MHEVPKSFSRRDLVLLQINFYAAIQERMIDAIEDEVSDAADSLSECSPVVELWNR